ncbi:MAG TPA: TcmI family type II polyketide cyclase [Streptosporangiaceae bacterium]|jgi:cyclase
MHKTLIVARLAPGDTGQVAEAFAESDRGELPHLAGVSERTLFTFRDLYFHLIESEQEMPPGMKGLSAHPLFADISARLRPFVQPYHPDWQGPGDAIATPFYHWPGR